MPTPTIFHHGEADEVLARRDAALARAYAAHPERFVKGLPKEKRPPEEAWISKPKEPEPPEDLQERSGSDEPSLVVNSERPEGSHGEGSPIGDVDRSSTTQ